MSAIPPPTSAKSAPSRRRQRNIVVRCRCCSRSTRCHRVRRCPSPCAGNRPSRGCWATSRRGLGRRDQERERSGSTHESIGSPANSAVSGSQLLDGSWFDSFRSNWGSAGSRWRIDRRSCIGAKAAGLPVATVVIAVRRCHRLLAVEKVDPDDRCLSRASGQELILENGLVRLRFPGSRRTGRRWGWTIRRPAPACCAV